MCVCVADPRNFSANNIELLCFFIVIVNKINKFRALGRSLSACLNTSMHSALSLIPKTSWPSNCLAFTVW